MVFAADLSEIDRNRLRVDALISGYSEDMGFSQAALYDQSGLLDAFGRLRVSEPYTIFDSKQVVKDSTLLNTVENQPYLFDNAQTAGAGTATLFDINTASTTLSVTAVTAGTRVRQSRRRLNYQPGKSQRALLTGAFGVGAAGITKRYGLFDQNNGLFFELDDDIFYVVQRTYVSGAPVDTRVAQSDWNIDTLDGFGVSKKILDITKTNIFYIHFEWLGVGSTRFGVVIDGMLHYAHQFNNANIFTNVYMSTPNLPVRMEISNDGTGDASTIKMICASVDSEGGVNPNGRGRAVTTGLAAITLPVSGTEYALLGIRLRGSHLGVQIDPTFISTVITSTADVARFRLHINPTVVGTFTYADLADTAVQAAVSGATPPTVTVAGTVIYADWIKTDRFGEVPERLVEKLGSTIAGVADQLVLAITPITNNTDVLCTMNWREL